MTSNPARPERSRREHTTAAPEVEQVGRLARLGALWSLVQAIGSQSLSVFSTAVLARLLLPSDYGILGMVATFTALLSAVSSMGLSWSTIRQRDLKLKQVHNLFWINTIVGVVLWAITMGIAPFLADFYAQPAVADVTRVLGATFVLSGIAVQPMALLQRSMRFRALSVITLVSQASGGVVAISMAYFGWGYWALVANALVGQLVRVVLAFAIGGYRPRSPQRDPATMAMVSFGGLLTFSSLISYLTRNVDSILVGRVWGAEQLGFYSRAYFLLTLPTMLLSGSLERVMVPALAALSHDVDRLGRAYRSALQALAFSGFPVAVGLTVVSPEAVRIVYGPNWAPVVPILAWFSCSMVINLIGSTYFWLYTTSGKAREMLLVRIASATLMSIAAVLGARISPTGVAIGVVFVTTITFVPVMYLAHRSVGLTLTPSLRILVPSLVAALVMGSVSFVAGWAAEQAFGSLAITTTAKIGTGVVVYGVLALFWLEPWPLPVAERYRVRALRMLRMG